MDRLDNPYRPGAGTEPPALIGRDQLIDHFGVTMRRALAGRPGKSFMPVGLRGVGKTVLLNRFTEIAEHAGFQVAFIEAPETGDFRVLLAIRLRKVLLALNQKGPGRRLVNRALGALRSFSYQLPDGGSISIGVEPIAGVADSGLLSEDLTDLLVAIGEAAAEDRAGVLLALDEVQYLSPEEFAALITAIHRTTQLNLPVVLVGAGLPQLPGLAGEAKSYSERLFDFPTIGSLEPDEAADVIRIPAEDLGVTYEPDALAMIIGESDGYPYFLQEWGYHVWNLASRSPISVDDIGSARLGVKVESVAPRRSALITKGMIYSPSHGDTAFTVPTFDEFLRRAVPAIKRYDI